MTPVAAIVVFILIWWMVLFTVLPWGVRRTKNPGEGHDRGAPARPMVARKLLITTFVSLALFAAFYAAVEATGLTLREIAERYRL